MLFLPLWAERKNAQVMFEGETKRTSTLFRGPIFETNPAEERAGKAGSLASCNWFALQDLLPRDMNLGSKAEHVPMKMDARQLQQRTPG